MDETTAPPQRQCPNCWSMWPARMKFAICPPCSAHAGVPVETLPIVTEREAGK